MVRSFFGHTDASDVNEAELVALLICCRELLKLGGFNAIIEGDSFLAIQWGSGRASHPWRLADWVE